MPDYVVSSPAERARQTVLAVCAEMGITEQAITWDDRIYHASTGSLMDVLAECPESAHRVLIAGHNPGLEMLVQTGLTPLEAITAGTANAARALGAEGEIGTIETGMIADLVILDADPLEDIRNTGRIWQVIQGGAVVDRAGLLATAAAIPVGMTR